ncbi:hypothetical protein PAPHI01_1813 [Pancytospora philotis]|nr:hypothetical protein PAPHI01_1813 [Pancytospora philotis]
MERLFDLREGEATRFAGEAARMPRQDVLEALRAAVNQVPSIAPEVSEFIAQLVAEDPTFKDPILALLKEEDGDEAAAVSRLVYLMHLGAHVSFGGEQPFPDLKPATDLLKDQSVAAKLPAFLADRKRIGENSLLDVFYCYAIIKNMSFHKLECCHWLKKYPNRVIIEALVLENSFSATSVAVEFCKYRGFFEELVGSIDHFAQRTVIIGLIFVMYYRIKPRPTQQYAFLADDSERQLLKSLFDAETEGFCRRIGNIVRLNAFLGQNYQLPKLPVMGRAEFEKADPADRTAYFNAFFALTSPSVTHFLSYLEFYKANFRLSDEEQQLFAQLLKDFHADNQQYVEIVAPKLAKFGIVKAEYL